MQYHDWLIVELPEKVLKGSTGGDFLQTIEKLSDTNTRIALDMHSTDFVDSSIVSMLLSLEKKLSAKGGGLIILSPRQQAMDLFSVTSVDRIIRIVSSKEELRRE